MGGEGLMPGWRRQAGDRVTGQRVSSLGNRRAQKVFATITAAKRALHEDPLGRCVQQGKQVRVETELGSGTFSLEAWDGWRAVE